MTNLNAGDYVHFSYPLAAEEVAKPGFSREPWPVDRVPLRRRPT
jgi:hypothetical protein